MKMSSLGAIPRLPRSSRQMSRYERFMAVRRELVWHKMVELRRHVVAASHGSDESSIQTGRAARTSGFGGAPMRRLVVSALPDTSAPRRSWLPAPRRSPENHDPVTRAAPPHRRVVRCGLSVTGFGVAAVFYCLSFTPSLLPRPWLLQGVVAGLTAAMGYAAGTAIGALVRLKWWPSRRVEVIAWRLLFALLPLLIVVFLWLGTRWQRDLRVRLGMEPQQEYDALRTVGVSLLTFGVLLLTARLLRLGAHGIAKLLIRVVPESAAYCAGFVVITLLSYGAFDGILVDNLYTTADRSAAITDSGTGRGVVQPVSTLRSGAPGSLVSWD